MNDTRSGPGHLTSAILGGLVGALLTAALLVLVVPQYLSGRIVRNGILADPQILVDAGEALRDRQYAPLLAQHRAAIETPFGTSWKGSSKPDVTLVEFYDYACPYCKGSNDDLEKLIREDPGVRVVYREFPILGPQSVTAARLSLAASKAGRFTQFHDTLWEAGKPGPETLAVASKAAGIDPKPQESADVEAELKKNFELASALGATGTPLFIIGDRVINSAVGYDELKRAVAMARKGE
ncbi:DsbA family protein [Sphingomonas sabuli]|uniref:DsbA family protein n=1 Tax=Sphingomonas sabuli TaxID=2764186 RepID=A0A7G9L4X2_9SPHN|nr:DsbA family protein [Sphingomonas sabuli]QNM83671.1 DsbA family protein [Sphingomonas sabuli]